MDTIITASIEALDRIKYFVNDIYGMSTSSIHLSPTSFIENCHNYSASQLNCDMFPIELSQTINGIKFFSLFTEEDFHEFT